MKTVDVAFALDGTEREEVPQNSLYCLMQVGLCDGDPRRGLLLRRLLFRIPEQMKDDRIIGALDNPIDVPVTAEALRERLALLPDLLNRSRVLTHDELLRAGLLPVDGLRKKKERAG